MSTSATSSTPRVAERSVHGGAPFAPGDALQLGAEAEVLADPHLRVERRGLRHVAHRRPRLEGRRRDVVPRDPHPPGRGAQEAREDAERCALARAVRAEEADHLAPIHAERDVRQRADRTVGLR